MDHFSTEDLIPSNETTDRRLQNENKENEKLVKNYPISKYKRFNIEPQLPVI